MEKPLKGGSGSVLSIVRSSLGWGAEPLSTVLSVSTVVLTRFLGTVSLQE